LSGAVGDDGALINAAGEFVETMTVATKTVFQDGEVQGSQAAYGPDSQLGEALFGDFAYAGDTPYGEREQEGFHIPGLDDEETVRFTPVRGDFGEELVGSDAGGGRETELVVYLLSNGLGDARGGGQTSLVF